MMSGDPSEGSARARSDPVRAGTYVACVALSLSVTKPARAQQVAPPNTASVDDRLRELERQNRKLREELDRLKQDNEFTKTRVDQVMPVVGKVTGYVDFGFFYVQGDGSGI